MEVETVLMPLRAPRIALSYVSCRLLAAFLILTSAALHLAYLSDTVLSTWRPMRPTIGIGRVRNISIGAITARDRSSLTSSAAAALWLVRGPSNTPAILLWRFVCRR